MSLRRQAVSGVKWTTVSMVCTTATGLVQLAVLTRLLSHADFGLMSMIMTVVGFAQVYADMGFSGAIIYRRDTTNEQLSTLYWMNLIASTGLFLIVLAVSPWVAAFFHEPGLRTPLMVTSLIFLITPVGQQFQMLLMKSFLFRRLAMIEILSALLGLVVAVSAALAHQGVYSLIYAQIASAAARAGMLAWYGYRHWAPRRHFRLSDLKGYFSFGLYQMGERSIYYWAANIDYLLIGRFLGAGPLGIYTIAFNLVVVPVTKLSPVLTRVAFPVFATRQHDDAALRRGYCEVVELVAFITFPLLVGLAASAPVAIVAVFGASWTGSVILVQLLTPMGMLKSIGSPTGSLFLAKGRADVGFWCNVAYAAATVVVLWLVVRFGTEAVAASHSAIAIAFIPVELYALWLVSRLRPADYLRRLVTPLAASSIMGAIVYASCVVLRDRLSPATCLGVLVAEGAIVYVVLWRLLRRDYMWGLWRMLRPKGAETA